MSEWNATRCRRCLLILPALIVFLPGLPFGMAPSAAETEHETREVFVGDATVGITWEERGSTYPAYGILSGLVSLADGEARLSPELKSLTVVGASAAQADNGRAALTWEEAAPLLARALAYRDEVGPALPGGEMDVIEFGYHAMFVPPALAAAARLASAGSVDTWAKRRSVRRKLYAAAALRAVTLQEAQRFDEMLIDDLAAFRSGAMTMLGATNYAASSGLNVYAQLRIISGMQAAAHSASTAGVAAKVTQRISASTLGKSVRALGLLAFAVDLAEGVSETRARQRMLAAAAADVLSIASLEDARRLLEAANADPAMTEGLSDAIGQLTALSQTRLEEYSETAGDALAGSLPSLAGAVAAYLGTGGAALVVREAAELGEELFGYTREVLTISAMATLRIALGGPIEVLGAGEEVGGSAAAAYAMRELVTLHDRLGAEAVAAVYNMLWTDRWRNSSSLAGIARGAGLTVADWLTADADTEEAYARETAMRVRRVREGAAFAAALPQILGALQDRYTGPPGEVEGTTTGDVAEAAASRVGGAVGNASFSVSRVITSEIRRASSAYAADLDGDGDLDVLSSSTADDKVAWYSNLGNGEFGEQRVIGTDVDRPESVFAADLDGDGDADVLSAGVDTIAWYENLGAAAFSDRRVITTEVDYAKTVFAADLDGDGDPDVLSASNDDDKIAWYENLGRGEFSEQTVITTEAGFAQSVFATDLDGDGDPDVLSGGGHAIAWYENLGEGEFSARRDIAGDADVSYSVFAADLDGDGDADVLSASTSEGRIAWHENLGGGTFSGQRIITTRADWAWFVTAADLDRDGDTDVLSASDLGEPVYWYENLGRGTFSGPRGIGQGVKSVLAADLDGDGDADLLKAVHGGGIQWNENHSGGAFSAPIVIASDTDRWPPAPVFAVDWDDDGDADVLAAVGNAVVWYENRGDDTFSDRRVIKEDAAGALSVYAVDLDEDGDRDFLSASDGDDEKIAWNENLGGGRFSDHRTVSSDFYMLAFVSPADLDGDGDADLLAASSNSAIEWFENLGEGRFSDPHTVTRDVEYLRSVTASDLDGDGDADVLSASSESVAWHENRGGGSFSRQRLIARDINGFYSAFAADLDGDGDQDVLSASRRSEIAWHENLGGGVFSEPEIIRTGSQGSLFAADFDGDGDADILVGASGRIEWYRNVGGSTVRPAEAGEAASGPEAGDENGGAPQIDLEFSVLAESPHLIEELLNRGADPNTAVENGPSLIHMAAGFLTDPAIVKGLIEAGADANARIADGRGISLLHAAARWNANPDVIGMLLGVGADLRYRAGPVEFTALHIAARFNPNPAIARRLLDAGADPNARGIDDITPLHRAAARNPNPEVVEALLAGGADPTARDAAGRTPLETARDEGRPTEIIAALEGPTRDCGGWMTNDEGLLRKFYESLTPDGARDCLRAGFDPNMRGPLDVTPLHTASYYTKFAEVIAVLVDSGADIGARAQGDLGALHFAAMWNASPAVIGALVDAGADPRARDDRGRTPLDIAKGMRRPADIVAALEDAVRAAESSIAVSPTEPGSTADVVVRGIAAWLGERFGSGALRFALAAPLRAEEDGYDRVTVHFPGARLVEREGDDVYALGDLALAVTAGNDTEYRFEAALPREVEMLTGGGRSKERITVDRGEISGIWRSDLETATRLDASASDIRLTADNDRRLAGIGSFALSSASDRGSDRLWDGEFEATLSDLRLAPGRPDEGASLSRVDIGLDFEDVDLDSFIAASSAGAAAGAGNEEAALRQAVLRGRFGRVEAKIALRGLVGLDGGEEYFRIGEMDGLLVLDDTEENLDLAITMEAADLRLHEDTVREFSGDLVPGSATADIALKRFPLRRIAAALQELAASGTEARQGTLEQVAVTEMAEAGTTLEIRGFHVAAPAFAIGAGGQLRIEAGSPFGAVGDMEIRLQGIGNVIRQAAAQGETETVDALVYLQGLGKPTLSGDGESFAYTYEVKMARDGAVTVNGIPPEELLKQFGVR